MNQQVENPFGQDKKVEATSEESKLNDELYGDIEIPEEELVFPSSFEFVSSSPYPFIDKKGNMKLGVAIVMKEPDNDDIFKADSGSEQMVIINSENGKVLADELDFSMDSLNKLNKSIGEEVFENLQNARKGTTLTKAFKDLRNTHYESYKDIGFDPAALTVLERTIKKTADTSKNIIKKIKESAGVDLDGMLTNYAFKKHLLITGDAGNGKTYIVDKFINDNKMKYVEEISHNGIESIDLIGHYVKKPDGTFSWKDGSFSEAFRIAQTEPVVYFIDEMLRMPARELNVLVGSLTPNSRGQLKLKTMRHVDEVDGISKTETITVPQENFWVVATSNQGSFGNTATIAA